MMLRAPRILFLCLVYLSLTGWPLLGADRIRFAREIRPIFAEKCFQCHGPDEKVRKAGLRLDRADGDDGAYRVRGDSKAIQPGSIDGSALWYRINTDDVDEVMPPPGAHKKGAVTSVEKKRIRQWILEGAEYEDFWAFVPPRPQDIPRSKSGQERDAQPIDRFVMARLEEKGLELNGEASRRALIRRVSFDLTGLPPSLEEIQVFLDDSTERAWENLVDRLLEKPHHGEHMARFWLDLVRFADTNGLHHDHYRQMTPYRDWVIRAFNDNLRFDNFITYQIAGDLFKEPSLDQQIASGFNRLHLIIDRGTALPQESFTRNVIDRVTAVGTAFLGLTVQCAVCHDHKYDPITQKDFYQLFAFFNNFDGAPETYLKRGTAPFKRGLHPPYIELPTPEQTAERDRIAREMARVERKIEELKSAEENSVAADGEALKTLTATLQRWRQKREAIEAEIPATLVMKERAEIRPAHILIRGVYDQPGEPVERNTPAFLPPLEKGDGPRTRMDLAEWLVDPSHPLTARVAVNRFWQQFFGVGLVKTSEDFGAQGEWPSHPALLDYLAFEFVSSGWNVKKLLRSIVLSRTYRQSSKADPGSYSSDPENRRLARGPRFRLDAETIRDQILSVSGLLNPTLYGKSVKPPQPPNLWVTVAMPNSYPRVYEPDSGDLIYRRSLYTFWKRALPPPQMSIFDAPTREACIARRERTNTPLQALVLMNEEQYFLAAMHCAKGLLEEPGLNDEGRIRRAYEKVTSELPGDREMESLGAALDDFRQLYRNDTRSLEAMSVNIADADPKKRVEIAAWTLLVHSLLNLDITKTRQ